MRFNENDMKKLKKICERDHLTIEQAKLALAEIQSAAARIPDFSNNRQYHSALVENLHAQNQVGPWVKALAKHKVPFAKDFYRKIEMEQQPGTKPLIWVWLWLKEIICWIYLKIFFKKTFIPGLGLRFIAGLLDFGILYILCAILSLPCYYIFDSNAGWFGLAIVFAYFVIPESNISLCGGIMGNGQTLGKKLLRIQVVRPDGSSPNLIRSAVRHVLHFMGFYVIFVFNSLWNCIDSPVLLAYFLESGPYIGIATAAIIFIHPLKRGLHDILSGTVVVRANVRDKPILIREFGSFSATRKALLGCTLVSLAMLATITLTLGVSRFADNLRAKQKYEAEIARNTQFEHVFLTQTFLYESKKEKILVSGIHAFLPKSSFKDEVFCTAQTQKLVDNIKASSPTLFQTPLYFVVETEFGLGMFVFSQRRNFFYLKEEVVPRGKGVEWGRIASHIHGYGMIANDRIPEEIRFQGYWIKAQNYHLLHMAIGSALPYHFGMDRKKAKELGEKFANADFTERFEYLLKTTEEKGAFSRNFQEREILTEIEKTIQAYKLSSGATKKRLGVKIIRNFRKLGYPPVSNFEMAFSLRLAYLLARELGVGDFPTEVDTARKILPLAFLFSHPWGDRDWEFICHYADIPTLPILALIEDTPDSPGREEMKQSIMLELDKILVGDATLAYSGVHFFYCPGMAREMRGLKKHISLISKMLNTNSPMDERKKAMVEISKQVKAEYFLWLLNDEDPQLRMLGAFGLAQKNDRAYRDALFTFLAKEKNTEVTDELIKSMCNSFFSK